MNDALQNPLVGNVHLNNGLFADYYLNEIVPTLPEWDETLFSEGKQALESIQALRADLHLEALDEAQLEERWIQPMLHLLGHHYAVQVNLRYRDRGRRVPDYVFFRSQTDARAITGAMLSTPTSSVAKSPG